jgi:hypothetical protein
MNDELCVQVLKEITGTRLFHEFDKIFAGTFQLFACSLFSDIVEDSPYNIMLRLHDIDMLAHCFPNFDVHIIKTVDEVLKQYHDILNTNSENFKHWKFYYLAISHNFTYDSVAILTLVMLTALGKKNLQLCVSGFCSLVGL